MSSTTKSGRTVLNVVVPQHIKWEDRATIAIKVTKPMYVAEAFEGSSMEPPTIIVGEDLDNENTPIQIIAGAVLVSEIEQAYPDQSYLGKGFELTRHPKKTGKKYHTFSVVEVAV